MATIEEKTALAVRHFCDICKGSNYCAEIACEKRDEFICAVNKSAYEQDRIARKEERERCYAIAKDIYCKTCHREHDPMVCNHDLCAKISIIRNKMK